MGYGGKTIREWLMSLATALEDVHEQGAGVELAESADEEANEHVAYEEGTGTGDGTADGTEAVPTHHRQSALLHLTTDDLGAFDSDSGED